MTGKNREIVEESDAGVRGKVDGEEVVPGAFAGSSANRLE